MINFLGIRPKGDLTNNPTNIIVHGESSKVSNYLTSKPKSQYDHSSFFEIDDLENFNIEYMAY